MQGRRHAVGINMTTAGWGWGWRWGWVYLEILIIDATDVDAATNGSRSLIAVYNIFAISVHHSYHVQKSQ